MIYLTFSIVMLVYWRVQQGESSQNVLLSDVGIELI